MLYLLHVKYTSQNFMHVLYIFELENEFSYFLNIQISLLNTFVYSDLKSDIEKAKEAYSLQSLEYITTAP